MTAISSNINSIFSMNISNLNASDYNYSISFNGQNYPIKIQYNVLVPDYNNATIKLSNISINFTLYTFNVSSFQTEFPYSKSASQIYKKLGNILSTGNDIVSRALIYTSAIPFSGSLNTALVGRQLVVLV